MARFSQSNLKQELKNHCKGGYRLETSNSKKENVRKQRKRALICLGAIALNLFSGAFNQAVAGPRDHSYNRARAEITNPLQNVMQDIESSLHAALPETEGKITIFNPFANTAAEIRRVERELDLPQDNAFEAQLTIVQELSEEYGITGKAFPYYNKNNDTVCVVSITQTEQSLPEIVITLFHEIGHCLDKNITPNYININRLELPEFRRKTEAFADVFVHSLAERNGFDPHELEHDIALRDLRDAARNTPYDTGDFLVQVQPQNLGHTYDPAHLVGWEDAIEEAHALVDGTDFSSDRYVEREIHSEAISEVIQSIDAQTPTQREDETIAFLRERMDVSNKIRRMVAGYDHIRGNTEQLRDYEPLDITLEQSMARALIHYQNKNDLRDLNMAKAYAEHLADDVFTSNFYIDVAYTAYSKHQLVSDLLDNPDTIEQLANGTTTLEYIRDHGLENTQRSPRPSISYDNVELSYNTNTSLEWGESILAPDFNAFSFDQKQSQNPEQARSHRQKTTVSFTSMIG